ncbi:uncharacterized [Tachysurus ichikawai]
MCEAEMPERLWTACKGGEGCRKGKASLVTSTLHTPATAGLQLEFSMEHVAQSSIYARYLYCTPGVFHGFCLLCPSHSSPLASTLFFGLPPSPISAFLFGFQYLCAPQCCLCGLPGAQPN